MTTQRSSRQPKQQEASRAKAASQKPADVLEQAYEPISAQDEHRLPAPMSPEKG